MKLKKGKNTGIGSKKRYAHQCLDARRSNQHRKINCDSYYVSIHRHVVPRAAQFYSRAFMTLHSTDIWIGKRYLHTHLALVEDISQDDITVRDPFLTQMAF